jgi:hypothetical protein
MTCGAPVPMRITVVMGVQLAIAVFFMFFAWSQTVSLAQGRPASWQDILALSLPVALVIAAWVAAVWLWGLGRRELAGLVTITPLILSVLIYMLLGAV